MYPAKLPELALANLGPRTCCSLRMQLQGGPWAQGRGVARADLPKAEPPAQLACVRELGQGMTRVRNGKVYL